MRLTGKQKTSLFGPLSPCAGPNEDAMQVLKSCSRMIRSNYDIFELTLQIEEYHEVMDDCAKCNDLRN
ncbi:hypothetical protein MRX96_033307 [Rhipicephalus microplus]